MGLVVYVQGHGKPKETEIHQRETRFNFRPVSGHVAFVFILDILDKKKTSQPPSLLLLVSLESSQAGNDDTYHP